MNEQPPPKDREAHLDRRSFLSAGVLAALGAAAHLGTDRARPSRFAAPSAAAGTVTRFSSSTTVPGPVNIPAGHTWELDPDRDVTLAIDCSGPNYGLWVQGTLRMRPNPGFTHRLVFQGVDESTFVGGNDWTAPLSTDPGLWVTDGGTLDLVGAARAGWNRTGTDPTWQAGDQVLVAPIDQGDVTTFAPFTPGSPVPRADQSVPPAEVFNLTRSVVIQGLPSGRAHVVVRNSMQVLHNIQFVSFAWLGPQVQRNSPKDVQATAAGGVLGRYPLHFHMSMNSGQVVRSCVAHDCGNHAFWPHMSDGIAFHDCVAYLITDDAYGWDVGDDTNQTTFAACLAAALAPGGTAGYPANRRLAGFVMGDGANNACRGCAVTGNGGPVQSSGFFWPPQTDSNGLHGVWTFDDGNVAHNNAIDGLLVWQDDTQPHVIQNFTAYRCLGSGIEHGAKSNVYRYGGCTLFECSFAGVTSRAVSAEGSTLRQTFVNITVAGGGVSQYGFIAEPSKAAGRKVLIAGPAISGCAEAIQDSLDRFVIRR